MSEALSIDYTDLQKLWWEESSKEQAGKLMLGVADQLWQAQEPRRRQNLRHAKLYSNQDLSSIYECGVVTDASAGVYLSVNLVEGCTNTLTAKMTRTRVRPSLQTEKGSRSLQRMAEGGTDFVDGVYHENELHEGEGEQVFVDGCLFGSGVFYTEGPEKGADEAEIVVERVLPDELLADPGEAVNGLKKRRSLFTLYRYKYIHRQQLYRMLDENGKPFADDKAKRAAIKAAGAVTHPGLKYDIDGAGQMVPVRFGWRLPSRPGADDGKFVVAIDGATLYAGPWKRMRFPFDFFHFQRQPTGLWGRSLAAQLVPIQYNINDQIEVIAEGQRLNARVRIIHTMGAINPDDFDNEIGRLVELAAGFKPSDVQQMEGKGATQEMYDDLERWIKRGYEATGVSMLSATAEKPEGITSAVALRELIDREDLRFSALGKRWERCHRDLGQTILETAAEAWENKTSVSVSVPGDKYAKRLDFGKLNLDMKKTMVKVKAASSLPTTPAARKQYARELLEDGAITMARYLEIIDESGDVRGVTSLVTAIQESIDLDIEKIVDDGKWRAPEKLRDPALARDTAIAVYAKSVHEDVPERNLELLRRYIILATKMASAQTPAAPMQAGQQAQVAEQAQQGPPGAMPAQPNPLTQPEQLPPDLGAVAPVPVPPVTPVM